jgi:hypothetical protein
MTYLFAIFLFFAGCAGEPADQLSSPDPKVDMTFMSQQAIEDWRAGLVSIIQDDAAALHPRDIWRYVADFHVDVNRPDPFLGDATQWDASQATTLGVNVDLNQDVAVPSTDEAMALESRDEEWAASEIWMALGRLDDARRCARKLETEGEWKAVAMIAVRTGDLASLDRATKMMIDDGQVNRTQQVAQYAFEWAKIDVVKYIANAHGLKLSTILSPYQIRQLALAGDVSALIELLDEELSAWERGDHYFLSVHFTPSIVVADIVLLSKVDRAKALEYARSYLALPYANVFQWSECGEACEPRPVAGSVELYRLVRHNPILRALYFTRMRQAIDDIYPLSLEGSNRPPTIIAGTGSRKHGIPPSHLCSHLLHVRQLDDSDLTRFWVDILETFPNRIVLDRNLYFEREVGRYALGLPMSQDARNVSPNEKLILEAMQGRADIRMDETWASWNEHPPSAKDMDEIEMIFHVLTRGEVTGSRQMAIRAELGMEEVPGEPSLLRDDLRENLRRSLTAHYAALSNWPIQQRLAIADEAYQTNLAATKKRARLDLPTIELYPDTREELLGLEAPIRELMCQKLPARCRAIWPSGTDN